MESGAGRFAEMAKMGRIKIEITITITSWLMANLRSQTAEEQAHVTSQGARGRLYCFDSRRALKLS